MQPFSRGESAFSLTEDYNFGIVIFQMNWQDYYCIMKEFYQQMYTILLFVTTIYN